MSENFDVAGCRRRVRGGVGESLFTRKLLVTDQHPNVISIVVSGSRLQGGGAVDRCSPSSIGGELRHLRRDARSERRSTLENVTVFCVFRQSFTSHFTTLHHNPLLRIQLSIPVEIVEPAVVQIVRREQAAVAMELVHGGRERALARKHPCLRGRQVALAQVAG